jgi:histidyl-tRNA synthetase
MGSSNATATARSAPRSSRSTSSSRGRPARPARWCRRRCTASRISRAAISRCGPRAPRAFAARTSSTQFSQIGAEVIGSPAPDADVEIIALFVDVFEAWGFEGLSVAVNSVGTPEIRAKYAERLREWLAPVRERLSADSQQRLEVNPLRVLDSKDPRDVALLGGEGGRGPLPRLIDALDAPAAAHWKAVLDGLDALGIAHEIDHGLVRGLDYYTHTAFEVHDRSLGAQSALGGGGRYDGLIEQLGGPATPGVGFSIGLDRAMLVLGERASSPVPPVPMLYLVGMPATRRFVQPLARALRQAYVVEFDFEGRAPGTQMKAADRRGARAVVLLGEDEWLRGEVVVRDMRSGEQETVMLEILPERLDGIMEIPGETESA